MAMMMFAVFRDFQSSIVPQIIALELVQNKTYNGCAMGKMNSLIKLYIRSKF